MLFSIHGVLSIFIINCICLPVHGNVSLKPGATLFEPDDEQYADRGAFEFDMVLTDLQRDSIEHEIAIRTKSGAFGYKFTRKMIANSFHIWPRSVIPYEIHPNLSDSIVQRLKSAMRKWQTKTCIRFVKTSPVVARILGHSDYVMFYPKLKGCKSNVGRIGMGKQYSNISDSCKKGSIMHELGHVVGFVHEQSRPDRDDNVKIMYKNIQQDKTSQFQKYAQGYVDSYNIPYDVGSIMHYSSKAFTANNLTTIQTIDKRLQMWMGQRDHLSFLDVKLANAVYRCSDHCSNKHTCKNGGYVGPTCSCLCPDGITCPTCENVVLSTSGCGGILRDPKGVIQSPRYPKNYIDNEDCFWFITGPDHSTIHLTFVDFSIEDDEYCAYDYLEVRVYGEYRVGQRPKIEYERFQSNIPYYYLVKTEMYYLDDDEQCSEVTKNGMAVKIETTKNS